MIQIEKIRLREAKKQKDSPFVGVVKLARPEKANALDLFTIKALLKTLNEWKAADCRVLLLGGLGNHFCAGLDLQEFLKAKKERRKCLDLLGKLFHALAAFPAPTVAAVQGRVTAGGVILSACCDFTYAENDTTFALTETEIGFASGMTYPFLLRRMDLNLLNRLIVLRERLSAKALYSSGFVTEECAKEEMGAKILSVINRLLEGDPIAQRGFKRFIGKNSFYRFPQGKEWTNAHKLLWETSDRKVVHRRIAQFLSKSKGPEVPHLKLPASWSWERF